MNDILTEKIESLFIAGLKTYEQAPSNNLN